MAIGIARDVVYPAQYIFQYNKPSVIRVPLYREIVATLERWPLVRERSKSIGSSSGKDLWPY